MSEYLSLGIADSDFSLRFACFAGRLDPRHSGKRGCHYKPLPKNMTATATGKRIARSNESIRSGSSGAPPPMEKALPRREQNFIREQTGCYDDEHDANNLVHGV
jgi:hypothetical protein